MSQITTYNTGGSGGSGIKTIDGDIGSVTGTTVSFNANAGVTAGQTVSFSANSATQMILNLSDTNANTILGSNTGSTVTGTSNTSIGDGTFGFLVAGSNNCASLVRDPWLHH